MLSVRWLAQPGSASGLGPEGRRFEPYITDHLNFSLLPVHFEEKVLDNKIREFIELPVADAYLISYAKTHNCILVTHEEPAYKINAKKKVHIPDVCNAMGVQYTSIYEIMRKEKDYHMIFNSK